MKYKLVEYWVGKQYAWFFIPENQSAPKLFQYWNSLPVKTKVLSYVVHPKSYTYSEVEQHKEANGGFKEELTEVRYESQEISVLA